MKNPRVRVTIADAREALLTGRERYDLVFSEPSNPYRAGVASLFTREFYEAAASRLETDGVFLQWLQAYEVDEQTVSTVLATLASVFPYVEVSDDRNLVEFSFARTVSRPSLFDISWLRRAAAAMGADRPSVDGAVDWERVRRQRLAAYTVADVTAPIERGMPEPDLVRARAHAAYLVGWLREAVQLFQGQPHPPEGAVETALFAEGLAERGDPAAVPYLQALVAVEPIEAGAAAARLALRTGRPEQARDALVSAFVQYRLDPWPTQSSMRRALRLAEEIATVRPDLAPSLFDATSEPFAAGAVGQQRRFTRVLLTAVPGMEGRCREAFEALEPFVPWTEELLRRRAACYGSQGPHAAGAHAELEEFRKHLTP